MFLQWEEGDRQAFFARELGDGEERDMFHCNEVATKKKVKAKRFLQWGVAGLLKYGLKNFLCRNELEWDDGRKGGAYNVSSKKGGWCGGNKLSFKGWGWHKDESFFKKDGCAGTGTRQLVCISLQGGRENLENLWLGFCWYRTPQRMFLQTFFEFVLAACWIAGPWGIQYILLSFLSKTFLRFLLQTCVSYRVFFEVWSSLWVKEQYLLFSEPCKVIH